VHLVGH
jgi:hypothetical protein